jgi:hypothetical protein
VDSTKQQPESPSQSRSSPEGRSVQSSGRSVPFDFALLGIIDGGSWRFLGAEAVTRAPAGDLDARPGGRVAAVPADLGRNDDATVIYRPVDLRK